MLLFEDPQGFQNQCLFQRSRGHVLGLVPTMGNLHEGHLSLVREAGQASDFVIVSIFVNPLQFNDPRDFERYPRTFAQDMELLQGENVSVVFHPTAEALYGKQMSTVVAEKTLTQAACGRTRPGHFEGVCTVVLKLLNLSVPHKVFFGEKDYQQLCVIKRMIENLNVPVLVRSCPTVREVSGLALSSRNHLLNVQDRKCAAGIYQVLQALKEHLEHHPGMTWQSAHLWGQTQFRHELGQNFDLEYLEAFVQEEFRPLSFQELCQGKLVICVAGKISGVRLIDNILLTLS